MRVLILGGDGFCGWPTALHLSNLGHEVAIVDNLSRRQIDIELECESLTPIRPMGERLHDLLKEWQPNAHRCDRSKIPCVSLWRQGGQPAEVLAPAKDAAANQGA